MKKKVTKSNPSRAIYRVYRKYREQKKNLNTIRIHSVKSTLVDNSIGQVTQFLQKLNYKKKIVKRHL